MTKKLSCKIASHEKTYDIEISHGSLYQQTSYLSSLGSKFAIITNDTLAPLYGIKLQKYLSSAGLETHLLIFPDGEQYKIRSTKETLEDQMFQKKLGRDTCLIALGGGVVSDLAGYVAATYCRGLPFVIMPTTLLAMVDAAIGGKTGVNVPFGKNLIGCIYQPEKVIIDPSVLGSLSQQERINGAVEMIKHGLIADKNYFHYLDAKRQALLSLDPEVIETAIYESCLIKKTIVEQDEKESGKRRLLNFGHTVGHALELLMNYAIPHGQAVAIGLVTESYLSLQLNELSQNAFDQIKQIFVNYGVPLTLPRTFPISEILEAMTLDKKSHKGIPRFVTIKEIGSPIDHHSHFCTQIDESMIINALKWMNHDLLSH